MFMARTTLRLALPASLLAAASFATAETYTAQIFSSPPGYPKMRVSGAGDNGLMSGQMSNGSTAHAAYRTPTGYKDMHPATGFTQSEIMDSWGSTYHCGWGVTTGSAFHALFWLGGGAAVDIHPVGAEYAASVAVGGGGQLQAGYVQGTINCEQCGVSMEQHACVWSRTTASFSRLHASQHWYSAAFATDGVRQVGHGTHRTDGSTNALMWNGPNSFAVNLRPSMSTTSAARAIWGNQQGGFFRGPMTGDKIHAVIWANTAASAVDLNPNSVFETTQVTAVRDGLQVGRGRPISTPTRDQAIAWHGTAGSWINLHSKLPAPYTLWHSYAEGIDNLGNVTGYIKNPEGTDMRAVLWKRS
jgi:hypothetical protein